MIKLFPDLNGTKDPAFKRGYLLRSMSDDANSFQHQSLQVA